MVSAAKFLGVSLPARLSVRLGGLQPIRGLQDTPADDDDVGAFVAEDFLWSGVLLAQHVTCRRGGHRKGREKWVRRCRAQKSFLVR